MDNKFDDYEIASLESMTAEHRNKSNRQVVINNDKYVQPTKLAEQKNNIKPAKLSGHINNEKLIKSTGQKSDIKTVEYTGHIDTSRKNQLSTKIKARAVAGAALAGIVLFNIVGRANSNPHELTPSDLMSLSSNSENFNKLNLSGDNLQSVIDFSNKYQEFYDRVQDEDFVLSDDDIHELQTYLDTYKILSKSVIADKVSSVTDVDEKNIIVVDSSRDFPFVTIAVRGKDDGGSLLNVGQRFNKKPLPTTLRNVAQNFINLHEASVELNIDKFDVYAESLNNALGNLNTFAGTELMYDGINFRELYFDKDAYSHQSDLNKSHVNDSITYASYENDDMDR